MKSIEKYVSKLVRSIAESSIYKEYKEQEENVMKSPDLLEKLDEFRALSFKLHEDSGKENLIENTELIVKQSAELRKNKEVNAYLDAELAMCRLLQEICREVIDELDIHVPEI